MMYSCFDVGGTAIKFGLIDEEGRFHKRGLIPSGDGPSIVAAVRNLVRQQQKEVSLAGIALSTAGIVNTESGTVEHALSIPGYTGTQWKTMLEEEFKLPVSVENDTNCATLGEYWLGAGKDVSSFFAVTVGTSIGGAIIEEGRVLHGATHAAGEIAYMCLPAGRFHDVASASFLCREIANQKGIPPKEMDGYRSFQLIESDDAQALRCFHIFCQNLADGLTNIISLFNPERIILGGGIMSRESIIRQPLEQALSDRLPERMLPPKGLAFARLQNDAGLLGALYVLKNQKSVLG
ncbi:ROK family protein [Megasphaera sp.]|uniref:ROK family protein n=1 Tax=Megasphaera sp. TaxID=2023260 RepID=UPI0025B91230|nr:ROK family protein [Megasphaera sp.]MBS5212434.1 ROK family protein [Megasphaera sp.]